MSPIISTTPDNERHSSMQKIPWRSGEKCYGKNPEHFKKYSHPHKPVDTINNQPLHVELRSVEPSEDTDSEKVAELQIELEVQQEIAQTHLELVEKQFLASTANLQNKNKYLEEEMEKLREEKRKLPCIINKIRRDTPSYWDINEFIQPYREIEIRPESLEFNILCGLLNETIGTHSNQFAAIYGKDSTELPVTKITRIHNKGLWHEHCFKKKSIIEKNEYWLFHGCDDKIVPILVYTDYDPRVSGLDGMCGDGFYLAGKSRKYNQYIPSPGCEKNLLFCGSGCSRKNQEDLQFSIILYRAVLGDVHIVKQYNKFRVRRPPLKENSINLYDSVMGESMKNGGNKLLYREFILYEPGQAYPEYVIKFKRSAVNTRPPSNIQCMKDECSHLLENIIPKTRKV